MGKYKEVPFWFESLVNLEGCKTPNLALIAIPSFESLVNLEGCKTNENTLIPFALFESLVNLEGCKTVNS